MSTAPWGGRRLGMVLLAGVVLLGGCRGGGGTATVSPISTPDTSPRDRLCPKLAETFYSRNELLVFFTPGSSTGQVEAVAHRLEQSPLVAAVSRLDRAATTLAFRELFANQPSVLDSVDIERLPGALVAAIPPLARLRQLDLVDELAGEDGVFQLVPASMRGQAIAKVLLLPWLIPRPVDWAALEYSFALHGVTTSRARAAWATLLGQLATLDGGVVSGPLEALVAAQERLVTRLGASNGEVLVGADGLFSDDEWERLRTDAAQVATAAVGTCGISLSG